MIAVDTSSLIALLQQQDALDTARLRLAIDDRSLRLPPPVLTELLSDKNLAAPDAGELRGFLLLDVIDGYWERAGLMRAKLFAQGLKSHLGDALIAQACIDAGVALITRDRDFRHYAEFGLKLAVEL